MSRCRCAGPLNGYVNVGSVDSVKDFGLTEAVGCLTSSCLISAAALIAVKLGRRPRLIYPRPPRLWWGPAQMAETGCGPLPVSTFESLVG